MKKIILLLALTGLTACSKAGGSKGVIECSMIKISGSESQTFTQKTEDSKIYEYKNSKDDVIYLDHLLEEFKAISYKTENSIYKFSRLVGFITVEYRYYLHLESKTVEICTKYVEYGETKSPDGGDPNAKEAYKCAKKRFVSRDYVSSSTIYIDDVNFNLEQNYYIKLGENSYISYVPKD
ncbi:MAG: hypothetical protein K6E21_00925 [Bacilli bacterium]|nr:hypothetical protein [Bacilli bacterium]